MTEGEFAKQIETLVAGRSFVNVIQTYEEGRAISILRRVCEKKLQRPLVSWDQADGFQVVSPVNDETGKPEYAFEGNQKVFDGYEALRIIDDYGKGNLDGKKGQQELKVVFALKDFHDILEGSSQTKRKLRNLSQLMVPVGKCIFLINPYGKIPDELRDEIVVLELPMPREEELQAALVSLESIKGFKVTPDKVQRTKLIQAALGLTGKQAKRAFRNAAVKNKGVLDETQIREITEEKRQVIRRSDALEYFPSSESITDIGGLEVLKDWLLLRKDSFGEEAKKYNLPAAKGVLLIGVPGTGKSLTAKAIGSIWGLPVLRLDTGALFGGLVGESEERTRRALDVANTVSPCVLWIDEIEKAFGTNDIDGGTSSRVFGSILTWMQEKTSPVFVVATANDTEKLPPELLRKGRFDEIFFLDLPSEAERREIFSVLLKKLVPNETGFDVTLLAKSSEYFVGAEIEEAIKSAMYRAFNDNRRPINTDDVLGSLKKMRPLAESHGAWVEKIRKWVTEGRLLSASFRSKKQAIENPPAVGKQFEDYMEVLSHDGDDDK